MRKSVANSAAMQTEPWRLSEIEGTWHVLWQICVSATLAAYKYSSTGAGD